MASLAPFSRPVLRQQPVLLRRLASRRFESTVADRAASAARESASKARDYQAKAQQGLSRVSSAAGPAIAGAAKGAASALGKIGGRTGRAVAFVERQTPFVVYYAKVFFEMAKIVFQGQKMNPPSIATFQSYYQSLWNALKSGSLFKVPQNMLQQLRNLGTPEIAAGAVIFAECVGFFSVGEMLGRFKIIGYHGEPNNH
ncbi:hypothetical protein CDD82_6355 [Ophiocordyceps australis]|uniref:Uncharacterized protein n=1 Tax=Ophiocordyceps australis TaxID=1399860 RepID=A0A2C5Y357_9HYPO|nr:hypothetical protein CDD82_6355 [Ophiocordyceps australis]